MRQIKAFIWQRRTNQVVEALRNAGFPSLTLSEAEGTGRYTKEEDMPSLRFPVSHSKMTKIEIVCKNGDIDKIVKLIHEGGGTGESGDGLIYVSEVTDVFKVRTGEKSRDDV
jgi:nitrogen regulatory protein P-II 1